MARLIVGCGYLGLRVADRWLAEGYDVYVLTRSRSRAGELEKRGLRPVVGDVTRPDSLPELPGVTKLLWSVGFDRQAGGSIFDVYVDGIQNLLDVLPATLGRFIYISSTGVFGQTNNEWVDESTPCEPRRAGGQACLQAERKLLDSPWKDRVVILRLAGIYGPHRLPRLRQLQAGEPLRTAADGMLNLIHVDDAARAIQQATDVPIVMPRVYLVADGHPVRRRDFYRELARLYDTPAPDFEPSGTDDPSRHSRSGGTKRVSNRRLLDELKVDLKYPSYREGLAAMHHEGCQNSPHQDRGDGS